MTGRITSDSSTTTSYATIQPFPDDATQTYHWLCVSSEGCTTFVEFSDALYWLECRGFVLHGADTCAFQNYDHNNGSTVPTLFLFRKTGISE